LILTGPLTVGDVIAKINTAAGGPMASLNGTSLSCGQHDRQQHVCGRGAERLDERERPRILGNAPTATPGTITGIALNLVTLTLPPGLT